MRKPPLFRLGQAVVCLGESWIKPHPGIPAPKKDGIYTVSLVEPGKEWTIKWWQFWKRKSWFLALKEFDQRLRFREDYFAPVELLSDEALAELLEETLAPVAAHPA